MSSRVKLEHLLASKAATLERLPSGNSRAIKYVTLGQTRRSPVVINRMRPPRRNHTQTSKSLNKSPPVAIYRQSPADRKYSVANYSRSVNLKVNQLNQMDPSRQDRLLALREQKLQKMKDLYSFKQKKTSLQFDRSKLMRSKAKINSFAQMPKRHSQVLKSSSKDKNLFNKRQDFHYMSQKKDLSQRYLPKYLEYCERSNTDEFKKNNYQESQNQLPQILKQQEHHIIGAVKQMKTVPQTPPLLPVTIPQKQKHPKISFQWFVKYYQIHLDILEDVDKSKFKTKIVKNGTYFGQICPQSQQPDGRGVIFYDNGKLFEGHFKAGQKHGVGYEQYPDQSFYMGLFSNGKRDGRGKFQWNNEQAYDGEWKNNHKAGSGIWKGANGTSYVGEWQNDAMEGFGVLIQQGGRYEGEFKNFMKWGSGTIRFDSGEVYTGTFKQNLPNGTGDYFWANQDHYHGEFSNGKRHGQGVLKYSNGGEYKGYFQNDKKNGPGYQSYQDGLFYQGDFKNDLRHGIGKLLCDRKVIFQGYWVNNSAVDPRKGRIEPIMEERESALEDHKHQRQQSYLSRVRGKQSSKKQNMIFKVGKYQPPKEQPSVPSRAKSFQRACNCQRHRKQRLQRQF